MAIDKLMMISGAGTVRDDATRERARRANCKFAIHRDGGADATSSATRATTDDARARAR